jgi:poly(3-hydroxybutyrate) depolymerase
MDRMLIVASDPVRFMAMRRIAIAMMCACSGSHQTAAQDGRGSDITGDASSDASLATCAGRTMQPTDSTWTLMVGSLSRTANVHVPASYDPTTPIPVVIDLHGRSATPGLIDAPLTHKADASFVVVCIPAWGSPTS